MEVRIDSLTQMDVSDALEPESKASAILAVSRVCERPREALSTISEKLALRGWQYPMHHPGSTRNPIQMARKSRS
ncbi:hypothetical protein [Stenotrophomonas maltophilia group sp. RNC7]|uniref:hypothetical protein n=1 Tax=Stenotrophomonas maltophilia group sp. RNC7 TaxID=3071467 RepID=UPI0027DFCB75|nr:hypothetical protein [Stenotrophomonas maltophilia group sp. RNC7]MDQ4683079.1 hypothetical protein [Stenotrophomonas maltophilia group sp. RNC7]